MTDTIGKKTDISISEALSLSVAATGESAVSVYSESITESLSLTDAVSKGQSVTQYITDSVSLTDSVSRDGATTVSLSETLQVSDVKSSTTSLLAVDAETDGDVFTELDRARGVDTFVIGSSTYAIVTSKDDDGVQIIDISDPTNIVAKDAETNGANGFTRLDLSTFEANLMVVTAYIFTIILSHFLYRYFEKRFYKSI